ncbi:MAG: ATP-binding protein [Deltaproteobacteria bacterium]|nr:ATP-binding protein [Deltaproteobacteria bacterium]
MSDENAIKVVLREWSYWERSPAATIPRHVLDQPVHIQPDLALVVQGVRRCGKSVLLAQIMQQAAMDPHDCFFINFEDPRLSDRLDYRLCDSILQYAATHRRNRRCVFFFDEIQNVQDWQKWLHTRLERPTRHCFVITGSNAALLSGELASALTGRHTTIELFPFDWVEYRRARPAASFETYLSDGGFPRALTYEEPAALLREYFMDILERDVRRHVAARSTILLTQLVKTIYESTGSEVSLRNLARQLDTTADTIRTYLDACEAAYILVPCPYFTFSERQRAVRNKKYYPIDLGLRQAVITRTGADRGKALETVVFQHLRRRYGQVYYWRQRGEVDFIVQDGSSISPYQVSWDGALPRHVAAAEEFRSAFPQAESMQCISRATVEEWLSRDD